jgi:hypothetical protein
VGNVRKLLVLMMFATLGVGIAAEQRREVALVRQPTQPMNFSAPWRPNGTSTETKVVGTVIDMLHVPVVRARVQLRDLKSGLVFASGDTNDLGEFEFTQVDPGTYVVEMLVGDNYIVALSNAVALARYATLNTVVQLPGRWDAKLRAVVGLVAVSNFFGIGSNNSMTASTLNMAADYEIRPVDAGEPVSPQ